MKSQEAIELLQQIGDRFSIVQVVLPVPDGPTPQDVEDALQSIKAMGYAVFVHLFANQEQIVITDKIDENVGSARD